MKKLLFAAAVACVCLTGGASILKKGDSIVLLGDSITNYGAYLASGYVNLCRAAFKANGLEVKVYPEGIIGHRSADMCARMDTPQILGRKPTYLTLSCGVNDAWHPTPNSTLDKYKEHITTIVDKAQVAGVKVILFTSTMIKEDADNKENKRLAPYNDFLRTLAKEKGCTLVDLNKEMQRQVADYRTRSGSTENFLTADGVHMDFLGNLMMARMVLKDGFGFTADEMKKAEEAMLKRRVQVGLPKSEGDVTANIVAISGARYLSIVEQAVAEKMSPKTYIGQKLTPVLSKAAEEIFKGN